MPLTALINGKVLCSVDFTDEEWEHLKKDYKAGRVSIILPPDNSPGYLRKSKLGTKHFVHLKKDHFEPESDEHLKIKEIIYKTCKRKSLVVETEHMEKDWIADVYCFIPGKRIVFEVQLSNLPVHSLLERQRRYEQSHITAVWLLKDIPFDLNFFMHVPSIRIEKDNNKYYVYIKQNMKMELSSFVEKFLSGKIIPAKPKGIYIWEIEENAFENTSIFE